MHAKWTRWCSMLAVVMLIAPLWAVAQPRAREPRSSDSGPGRSRGEMQVTNDWRDEVNLSVWSDNRERLGEWTIRPGENVVLQERGERLRVRPNYKIKVGDDGDWVDVEQVGQFQNGTWYVNVRNVRAATQQDRPEGRDSRRGEVAPREDGSPLDQILKKFTK